VNEIAALVSLKHKMQRNRMPVASIRQEMKQRVRQRFSDLRFVDLFIIEGLREFGEGARMMDMPGTNSHCYSLARTPLDVLARDRPTFAGVVPFDERVLLGGKFPLALASVGAGSFPKGSDFPTLYIASASSGALALLSVSGFLVWRSRSRRRTRAAHRRRVIARAASAGMRATEPKANLRAESSSNLRNSDESERKAKQSKNSRSMQARIVSNLSKGAVFTVIPGAKRMTGNHNGRE